MPQGYLALVLHAHLPYVLGHGRWPHGAEWLYEAACETYIPLLNALNRLSGQGKKAGFTIGLTPILCEMLASGVFKRELKDYIQQRIGAAEEDRSRFLEAGEDEKARLAHDWVIFYETLLHDFSVTYDEDLLEAFKRFQNHGQIEIIASSATHAYLPLIGTDTGVSAQVKQGLERYESFFGSKPKGMWLPECGYRPASPSPSLMGDNGCSPYRKGIEEILAENNIDYFFLDTHLLGGGKPLDENTVDLLEGIAPSDNDSHEVQKFDDFCYCPSFGLTRGESEPRETALTAPPQQGGSKADHLAPHFAGSPFSRQVCAFLAREPAVSMQVWSRDHGYPGDGDYLEFHKKDSSSGLRYWKVTDRAAGLDAKEIYGSQAASAKTRAHAAHFVSLVSSLLTDYYERTGQPGVLTAPFDAELFGHWWFEGVKWLETVAELLAEETRIQLAHPRDILKRVRPETTLMLPEGSWGQGGCHTMWYNRETAWMWQSIHKAEGAFREALNNRRPASPLCERILRQMGRELLLLQASDWQFLVTTRTAREYAESRFLGHEENFLWLQKMVQQSSEDEGLTPEDLERLRAIEEKDPVFDSINLSWFEERTENGL